MLDKLKKKWGIKSNLQAILIMVVFSLAGSSIVWVRRLVFPLMGIHESTPFGLSFLPGWLFFFLRIKLCFWFLVSYWGNFLSFGRRRKKWFGPSDAFS